MQVSLYFHRFYKVRIREKFHGRNVLSEFLQISPGSEDIGNYSDSSCTFKNVTIAIGNHSTSSSADNYQSNIVVSNCDFDGAKKEKKVQFSDLTKVTFK